MINLLPPAAKLEHRAARTNTVLRRYLIILLLAIVAMAMIFGGALYINWVNKTNYEAQLNEHSQKLADLDEVRQKTKTFNDDVRQAQNVFNSQISLGGALAKIAEKLPEGAVLSSLGLKSQELSKPLALTARVDSVAKAAVLKANFDDSPDYFKSTVIQSVTSTTGEGGPYAYTVNLEVTLNPKIANPITGESGGES